MQQWKKTELLAPVGSMQSLYAAVQNGCDAVYLGGKSFSARQYAGNFSDEELEKVCDYCHLRGVRVYVTVNTVYKESELPSFLRFIDHLYRIGTDALIIQDLGAAMAVRERYPDFQLHASTQMTANDVDDVNFLYAHGFSKVVLSRELSLGEIAQIAEQTEAEIETFVHGALCVCYSGQCIMSSMLGGRSGNRGRCAQTCRLPYQLYREDEEIAEGYLLSPKDMSTLRILPELVEAGITSFKIEGRMKSPEYVGGVTAIYRKYMDLYENDPEGYEVDPADEKVLLQLFNRGGFTTGYYESIAGRNMMSVERPKTWGLKVGFVDQYLPKYHKAMIRTREALVPGDGIEIWASEGEHVGTQITKPSKAGEVITITIEGGIEKNDVVYRTYDKALHDRLEKTWEKDTRKSPVWGALRAKVGEPLALQLWDNRGSSVYVTGEAVQRAEQKPLSQEELRSRVEKMGATPFYLEGLELEADDNIYCGIRQINELRREAAAALEKAMLRKTKRSAQEEKEALFTPHTDPHSGVKRLQIQVETYEQFSAVVRTEGLSTIYFEVNAALMEHLEDAITLCHSRGVKLYASMSRIRREMTRHLTQKWLKELKGSKIDGFLVRSAGEFQQAKEYGKEIAVDYTLNVTNAETLAFWQKEGAASVCLSPELNAKEIAAFANRGSELLVYGYLPLMTTQQCPIGNYAGGKDGKMYCTKRGDSALYYLKDRKGAKFPLMPDCTHCVCKILNGKPLFTLKFYDEVLQNGAGSVRLMFTKESGARAAQVARAYAQMTENPKKPGQAAQELLRQMERRGSTKGHFFRGVE